MSLQSNCVNEAHDETDKNGTSWTDEETLALIRLWEHYLPELRLPERKFDIFRIIAHKLGEINGMKQRTEVGVDIKIRSLTVQYNFNKEKYANCKSEASPWRFFSVMHNLFVDFSASPSGYRWQSPAVDEKLNDASMDNSGPSNYVSMEKDSEEHHYFTRKLSSHMSSSSQDAINVAVKTLSYQSDEDDSDGTWPRKKRVKKKLQMKRRKVPRSIETQKATILRQSEVPQQEIEERSVTAFQVCFAQMKYICHDAALKEVIYHTLHEWDSLSPSERQAYYIRAQELNNNTLSVNKCCKLRVLDSIPVPPEGEDTDGFHVFSAEYRHILKKKNMFNMTLMKKTLKLMWNSLSSSTKAAYLPKAHHMNQRFRNVIFRKDPPCQFSNERMKETSDKSSESSFRAAVVVDGQRTNVGHQPNNSKSAEDPKRVRSGEPSLPDNSNQSAAVRCSQIIATTNESNVESQRLISEAAPVRNNNSTVWKKSKTNITPEEQKRKELEMAKTPLSLLEKRLRSGELSLLVNSNQSAAVSSSQIIATTNGSNLESQRLISEAVPVRNNNSTVWKKRKTNITPEEQKRKEEEMAKSLQSFREKNEAQFLFTEKLQYEFRETKSSTIAHSVNNTRMKFMTGYSLFSSAFKKVLEEKFTDMSSEEIRSAINSMWKDLTEEEKREYGSEASRLNQENDALASLDVDSSEAKILALQYQCLDCSLVFGGAAGLLSHAVSVHKNPKPFRCSNCFHTFNSSTSLWKHSRQTHRPPQQHYCKLCFGTFSKHNQLIRHIYQNICVDQLPKELSNAEGLQQKGGDRDPLAVVTYETECEASVRSILQPDSNSYDEHSADPQSVTDNAHVDETTFSSETYCGLQDVGNWDEEGHCDTPALSHYIDSHETYLQCNEAYSCIDHSEVTESVINDSSTEMQTHVSNTAAECGTVELLHSQTYKREFPDDMEIEYHPITEELQEDSSDIQNQLLTSDAEENTWEVHQQFNTSAVEGDSVEIQNKFNTGEIEVEGSVNMHDLYSYKVQECHNRVYGHLNRCNFPEDYTEIQDHSDDHHEVFIDYCDTQDNEDIPERRCATDCVQDDDKFCEGSRNYRNYSFDSYINPVETLQKAVNDEQILSPTQDPLGNINCAMEQVINSDCSSSSSSSGTTDESLDGSDTESNSCETRLGNTVHEFSNSGRLATIEGIEDVLLTDNLFIKQPKVITSQNDIAKNNLEHFQVKSMCPNNIPVKEFNIGGVCPTVYNDEYHKKIPSKTGTSLELHTSDVQSPSWKRVKQVPLSVNRLNETRDSALDLAVKSISLHTDGYDADDYIDHILDDEIGTDRTEAPGEQHTHPLSSLADSHPSSKYMMVQNPAAVEDYEVEAFVADGFKCRASVSRYEVKDADIGEADITEPKFLQDITVTQSVLQDDSAKANNHAELYFSTQVNTEVELQDVSLISSEVAVQKFGKVTTESDSQNSSKSISKPGLPDVAEVNLDTDLQFQTLGDSDSFRNLALESNISERNPGHSFEMLEVVYPLNSEIIDISQLPQTVTQLSLPSVRQMTSACNSGAPENNLRISGETHLQAEASKRDCSNVIQPNNSKQDILQMALGDVFGEFDVGTLEDTAVFNEFPDMAPMNQVHDGLCSTNRS